jgi:membrane protein required for colicin V production
MIWIDYVLIAIIVISTLISLVRGFFKETLSLISWIAAFFVAKFYHAHFATLLVGYVSTASLRLLIAFFAIFVVTLILGALINHLISQLVEKTGLTGTDRALGMIFGALRGVAIIVILMLAAATTPMPQDDWWQQSLLVEHFQQIAVWVMAFLPEQIAEYIQF